MEKSECHLLLRIMFLHANKGRVADDGMAFDYFGNVSINSE